MCIDGGRDGTGAVVTYYENIKPIVDAHCTNCRSEGNIAPFSLDIPGPADFHPIEVRLEGALPEGSRIVLHLHNHGSNSYRWEPVELLGD
jgi:hypothetical protein